MAQQRLISPGFIPSENRVGRALDENVIADHLEKFLEAPDNKDRNFVFSAPLGGTHVYCFAPSEVLGRNHWTLVTMGMSGTTMNVPQGVEDGHLYQHAEVMCYLPPDWKFPPALDGGNITAESWPIDMLRSLSQYVQATGSWLAEDHGVPNLFADISGPTFVPSTKLSHMILLNPVMEDEDFGIVNVNGAFVNLYLVVPLTAAEAAWKREVGASNSIYYIVGSKAEGGEHVLVDYIIDPSRPCCVNDLNCRDVYDNLEYEDDEENGDEEDGEEGEEDKDGESDDENEPNTSAQIHPNVQ